MQRNPANFMLSDGIEMFTARYHALRQNGWSETHIDRMLDAYEKDIFDSGAYLRDVEKWPDSSIQEPALKLTLFRNYVHQRLIAMDDFISDLGTD